MKLIYLDTAAATPLDPRVVKAMRPYGEKNFANPSSIHDAGVVAARAVAAARRSIAAALATRPDEVIFTSGGTEANNLALFGLVKDKPGHIITSVIEHASILEPCRALEQVGFAVTYLSVNQDGLVDPSVVKNALRPDTILVSIGYANNEIGIIQPIREIAKVIRHSKFHPYFHTDACQAPRFLDCRVSKLGVDLMTLNSAKIYGPKGIGALYCRRGLSLTPLVYGGGQERGLRSGTENVAGIVGFAKAFGLCVKSREKESVRLIKLRDYFIKKLLALPGVTLNGSPKLRLPDNINVSFAGADSEFVVLNLDAAGVAASSGSACSTNIKDASYVIEALGHSPETAHGAVRFTLGRDTTKADLDYVLNLPDILSHAGPMSR